MSKDVIDKVFSQIGVQKNQLTFDVHCVFRSYCSFSCDFDTVSNVLQQKNVDFVRIHPALGSTDTNLRYL